ncbi:MAG: hypothetical protein ABW004_02450, partial [Aeromicrobium sp.]
MASTRPWPTSRSRPSPRHAHTTRFEAIGTAWEIDSDEPLSPALRADIDERIASFDRTWSRFRDDSLVAHIATTPGRHVFPAEAPALFD